MQTICDSHDTSEKDWSRDLTFIFYAIPANVAMGTKASICSWLASSLRVSHHDILLHLLAAGRCTTLGQLWCLPL
jgi:hypothetical protein